jgi:hypothetical protein
MNRPVNDIYLITLKFNNVARGGNYATTDINDTGNL